MNPTSNNHYIPHFNIPLYKPSAQTPSEEARTEDQSFTQTTTTQIDPDDLHGTSGQKRKRNFGAALLDGAQKNPVIRMELENLLNLANNSKWLTEKDRQGYMHHKPLEDRFRTLYNQAVTTLTTPAQTPSLTEEETFKLIEKNLQEIGKAIVANPGLKPGLKRNRIYVFYCSKKQDEKTFGDFGLFPTELIETLLYPLGTCDLKSVALTSRAFGNAVNCLVKNPVFRGKMQAYRTTRVINNWQKQECCEQNLSLQGTLNPSDSVKLSWVRDALIVTNLTQQVVSVHRIGCKYTTNVRLQFIYQVVNIESLNDNKILVILKSQATNYWHCIFDFKTEKLLTILKEKVVVLSPSQIIHIKKEELELIEISEDKMISYYLDQSTYALNANDQYKPLSESKVIRILRERNLGVIDFAQEKFVKLKINNEIKAKLAVINTVSRSDNNNDNIVLLISKTILDVVSIKDDKSVRILDINLLEKNLGLLEKDLGRISHSVLSKTGEYVISTTTNCAIIVSLIKYEKSFIYRATKNLGYIVVEAESMIITQGPQKTLNVFEINVKEKSIIPHNSMSTSTKKLLTVHPSGRALSYITDQGEVRFLDF